MMNVKSYNVNTREGEVPSFDLEAEEFVVTILQDGKDCTVIDNDHGKLYMVQADTTEKAVKAYIDWLYGMVNEWAADPDEFGFYGITPNKVWMSATCDIRETVDSYEYVVES